MRLTRDHAPWAAATLAVTAVAAAGYAVATAAAPYGASGGSWAGLAFGVAALFCMLAAAFLSVRKKLLLRRIGSAQLWMKIHLWLGALTVPLVLLHSGFRIGGTLTVALMLLFAIVTLSGLFGLAAQHVIPTRMTAQVPLETATGQIDHVAAGLRVDAYELVAAIAGVMPDAEEERAALSREQDEQVRQPGSWKEIARQRPAQNPAPESAALRDLYLQRVRPFLRGELAPAPDLFGAGVSVPDEWGDVLQRLTDLCEECRQLRLQQRLQRLLHAWLYVHAPLSIALLVLVALHALYALRY